LCCFFLAKGKLSLVIDYQLKKKKDKAQNDKKNLAENNNEEKIYENN
jgi:hypothetical protein